MIKINALNDKSGSASDGNEGQVVTTKEAQEEAAYCLYNKALELQKQGDKLQAEETFKELLQTQFISKAAPREDEDGPLSPAHTLKYLACKNMASIAAEREDYNTAMESYLDAINIDATDVTIWYKMGLVALKLHNYPLARLSFEEGLKCNPKHWPCLDNVITVLYVLNDYANCLYYISIALERECSYIKGLTFRNQIYEEHDGLRSYCEDFFKKCDESIYKASFDKSEGQKFIDEALTMREKKRELSKSSPLPELKFKQPLVEFKWKQLGERLISMYDYILNSNPRISFGCRLNLATYLETLEKPLPETKPEQEKRSSSPATVSSSSEAYSIPLASPASVPTSQSSQALQLCSQEKVTSTGEISILMETEETPIGCVVTTATSTEIRTVHSESTSCLERGRRCPQKRGPKRKRLIMESMDSGIKRRSARVRNTLKKHQENTCVNYQDLLKKFLPPSLSDAREELDEDEHVPPANEIGTSTLTMEGKEPNQHDGDKNAKTVNLLSSTEVDDVKKFLSDNQNNGGVLDVLYKYLIELSARSDLVWPQGLVDIYLSAYTRAREHYTLPSLFSESTDVESIKDQGLMTLLYMELKIDKWHNKGHSSTPKGTGQHGSELLDKFFMEDLNYLFHISILKCVFGDYLTSFMIRALWLKGKFHSFDGDIDVAVGCFDQLLNVLQEAEEENKAAKKENLLNCTTMNVISTEHVREQLELLQCCQSLEEVHKLYEKGDFQAVVDLLVPTFRQAQTRRKISNDGNVPERYAQLCLLQDSLWKLKNYQECLTWGEVAFHEALNQYMTVITATERTVWAETMSHLLAGLNRCVTLDEKLLDKMEKSKLVRFANNLISLISLQMIVAETILESDIPIVSPWILLYILIRREELKIQAAEANDSKDAKKLITDTIAKQTQQEGDFALGMPSSLMLLFTAHECLGRFAWCSGSDGALLLLSVDVMSSELQKSTPSNPNPFREDLESGLEQCFYCLYGHPSKRTKAKHLQEHNAQMITLTWERSFLLFEYFKPSVLPEFDSYRTNTVSAELENLLRRILALIPADEDPSSRVDAITAYIEGGTDKCPVLPDDKNPSTIVKSLYYLLGDYYFKNKEFGKAIKFYILDICVNPDRFDSWAGMALARSSQLEQKLSCCDLKNEGSIYRKSTSALRCFKHALELDSTHTSLWIEYGSIAYMLHSHTSRQLKQQAQFNFGEDVLELLHRKKKEMLVIAENCFLSANSCEIEGVELEEVWLHHYMLGKIAEKKQEHPKIYLEHYKQAAKYLHEDEARYPKKIHYHNPPELSIEALEIYYRIHVSILKYLFKQKDDAVPQDDLEIFQTYLTEAANSPFAKFQEKRELERESRYTSLSSSEAEESLVGVSVAKKTRKAATVANDHDYFQGQRHTHGYKPESAMQRGHRVSIDSSSESQDSAAVKDVLNSIVAVVSESCVFGESHNGPTLVLGDHKIRKMVPKKEEVVMTPVILTADSNVSNSDQIQFQPKPLTNKIDFRMDNPLASILQEKSPILTEIPVFQSENTVKVQETIEEFLLPKRKLEQDGEQLLTPVKEIIKNLENITDIKKIPENMELDNEKVPNELKIIIIKDEPEPKRIIDVVEKQPLTKKKIVDQCLKGVRNCLQRFTQHYKSLYRLSHYYCYSAEDKKLPLSREILLGIPAGQSFSTIGHQGLFAERKNTNFFNGIWRIPIDEIDRPGSFSAHMYRSIVLLVEVLHQLKDHVMLLHLTVQLSRIPDLGKKYLRDTDRTHLARDTFTKCLNILRDQLNSLMQEEPPPEEGRLITCLLDIYRTWQSLQKAAVFPELANELLEEAYRMYKLGEVDRSPPVLDQAIRFCQLQQLKQINSQTMQDLSRNLLISGILVKPTENITDGLATSYTAINSTTITPPRAIDAGQTESLRILSANDQNLEALATLIVSQNSTLSLTYISSVELQSNETVASQSRTPIADLGRAHAKSLSPYITYPVVLPEAGTARSVPDSFPTTSRGTGSYVMPQMHFNVMRKRWQTHGGRRHRFGGVPSTLTRLPTSVPSGHGSGESTLPFVPDTQKRDCRHINLSMQKN
ncbi:calcineurin-binding protein cabin-1-like [Centruroides sculpturatus]|uniref:calcineurin-binding protein cabin-1-like n=1 Tax=Centruroides sculpturatus TaxID=218467 RepID=UPI000C6DF283|nr:calcineurin-binding protein cabin-1-like [Centruroides sculpturatus]XP_023231856.1 calcineurin-binding protein cabin-1-like [Centruroides sculpturatus]